MCIFVCTGERNIFELIEDGLKCHNDAIKEAIPFDNCMLVTFQYYFGNNGFEDDIQVRQSFRYQHSMSNLMDNFEIQFLDSDNNLKYSLIRFHKPKDNTGHWYKVIE